MVRKRPAVASSIAGARSKQVDQQPTATTPTTIRLIKSRVMLPKGALSLLKQTRLIFPLPRCATLGEKKEAQTSGISLQSGDNTTRSTTHAFLPKPTNLVAKEASSAAPPPYQLIYTPQNTTQRRAFRHKTHHGVPIATPSAGGSGWWLIQPSPKNVPLPTTGTEGQDTSDHHPIATREKKRGVRHLFPA